MFSSSSGSSGPKPIKVVRIIDRLNAGGPAKHVVWLTKGMEAEGFQTTLITGSCADGETDMTYFARDAGIEPLVIPGMSREIGLRDARVLIRLIRELFRIQPDIVHTHKSKAGTLGRIAAIAYKWLTPSALRLRPRRCKAVHTYHGHIFHCYYSRLKTCVFLGIERLLAWLCTDRIIVISELQRQEICEHFRVGRPQQFRVIPLGMELQEPSPEAVCPLRRELGLSAQDFLVGTVGRLTEIKNQLMLLHALKELAGRLAASGIRVHLVLIGDGHLRNQLARQATELGVDQQVTFLGFRPDVLSLYPAFDVVALTSLNEGTPLTLIEAMSMGRPVASTEVGGVPDLLGVRRQQQERVSVWAHGVSVRSGDVHGFARALQLLAENPDLRGQMGFQGRAFVHRNFSRERLLRNIQDLYRELSPESAAGLPIEVQPSLNLSNFNNGEFPWTS